MLTLILLIIFFGVLFVFGWQLSRLIINEKRIEALIPLAVILGCSIYLFLINLLSQLINIRINFYLLCLIFALLSCFFYRINKKREKAEWGIDKKWRKILFSTCFFIMVLVGVIGIRLFGGDDLNHLPLSATIAQGNFPVRDIMSPNFNNQYHYGYNLFSAAVSGVTNLPIWFSEDLRNSILIGVIFLLGFLLINDFCKGNFKAYIASLAMIFGGNLNFLYGLNGLFSLYQKYVLHNSVEASYKFLNDMIFGSGIFRGGPMIAYSRIGWLTLSFALVMTVIYLYFKAADNEKNWLKIAFLAGLVFSFLALSAELFFGALGIVLLIYPLIFAILKNDWKNGKARLKISFLILFLGTIFASFQGGVITQNVKQMIFGSTFPLEFHPSIMPGYLFKGVMLTGEIGQHHLISIFSSTVFLEWGWLMIFVVPVALYFLKKCFQLGLFLILLISILFFVPLVVSVDTWQGEVTAFFNHLLFFFWNLIFGLFLGWSLLFFKNKLQKLSIIILIFFIIFQGLLYSIVSPIFPGLERTKSFLGEPKMNPVEFSAIEWIKNHTTIKDYFLTFGEELESTYRNSKFVILTGRIAPGFYYGVNGQLSPWFSDALIPETLWYQKVLKECSSAALEVLHYRYLYVNENWPRGLEERCLDVNDLELEFSSSQDRHFARIYLIRYEKN